MDRGDPVLGPEGITTMLARIRKSMDEKDEGFTLIELLVVIIIIGILAAIAIPVFLNQRKKGYDAAAKSDLRNAATSEETYLTDNSKYTTATADLTTLGWKQSSGDTVAVISVRPAGTGTDSFCLSATSQSTKVFYYDSAAGGLTANNGSAACT